LPKNNKSSRHSSDSIIMGSEQNYAGPGADERVVSNSSGAGSPVAGLALRKLPIAAVPTRPVVTFAESVRIATIEPAIPSRAWAMQPHADQVTKLLAISSDPSKQFLTSPNKSPPPRLTVKTLPPTVTTSPDDLVRNLIPSPVLPICLVDALDEENVDDNDDEPSVLVYEKTNQVPLKKYVINVPETNLQIPSQNITSLISELQHPAPLSWGKEIGFTKNSHGQSQGPSQGQSLSPNLRPSTALGGRLTPLSGQSSGMGALAVSARGESSQMSAAATTSSFSPRPTNRTFDGSNTDRTQTTSRVHIYITTPMTGRSDASET
jgi:hypothetical protein